MTSKVVITGSTGLIGSQLMECFPNSIRFQGDICDKTVVDRFIYSLEDVSGIVHLAAIVPKQVVDNNVKIAFDVNVGGTLNILEALRNLKKIGKKSPWLFYASTSHVYASSDSPVHETDKIDPLTFYGRSKLQGEEWCRAYAKDFKIPLCVGRLFSFSDSNQPDFYFIPAMFKKVLATPKNGVMEVQGVRGVRDFLRVPQICKSIYSLYEKKYQGIVNVGTGKGNRLFEIVNKVIVSMGREDIKLKVADDLSNCLIANTDRLESLGINCESEVDILIKEMALHYENLSKQ